MAHAKLPLLVAGNRLHRRNTASILNLLKTLRFLADSLKTLTPVWHSYAPYLVLALYLLVQKSMALGSWSVRKKTSVRTHHFTQSLLTSVWVMQTSAQLTGLLVSLVHKARCFLRLSLQVLSVSLQVPPQQGQD